MYPTNYYIALGTNVGNYKNNFSAAISELSKLGQISTEFIPNTDYGEGCKYSLFEQAIECTKWMKKTWETINKAA